MDRSSGILLPVSALPGPCGIGDLGADARDFIDFLAAAGQRYWQILPLNPPDGAHSPYLSASTFAGSTDLQAVEKFLHWLDRFSEENGVKFTVTISADEDTATEGMKQYI